MKAAALRALELDPTSPEAHTALGNIQLWFAWDPRAADTSFRRALANNPRYAPAYASDATALVALGRNEEAVMAATRAQDLDPLFPGVAGDLINAGHPDVAIRNAGAQLLLDSTDANAHFLLGQALLQLDKIEEGIEHLRRAVGLSHRVPYMAASLGHWEARVGRSGAARSILNELTQRAEQIWVMPIYFAEVYAGLGDSDSAFAWLERGLEDRAATMMSLTWSREWDSIRADPRFSALLRRMGLAQ